MKRSIFISVSVTLLFAAMVVGMWYFAIRAKKGSSSASSVVFQYGDEGEAVMRLQEGLNDRGYNLVEDGIFGSKTLSAVTEYFGKNTVTLSEIEKLES